MKKYYKLIILHSKCQLKLLHYSLVYGVEVVFPLKCQILFLRIAIHEGLSSEDIVCLCLKELEALYENLLEAQ